VQNERLKKRHNLNIFRFDFQRHGLPLLCSSQSFRSPGVHPELGISSPNQPKLCVRKTFGQATMAFYGLFACHPLTVCPTIQLLNSSEVIRQAETDPLVDGTGCEVVPCLKVLQTPCVLHWWIFFDKFHLLRCYQESLQKMCEV